MVFQVAKLRSASAWVGRWEQRIGGRRAPTSARRRDVGHSFSSPHLSRERRAGGYEDGAASDASLASLSPDPSARPSEAEENESGRKETTNSAKALLSRWMPHLRFSDVAASLGMDRSETEPLFSSTRGDKAKRERELLVC